MSDIVERLRDEAETELEWTTTYKIMTEAADEIDRLRLAISTSHAEGMEEARNTVDKAAAWDACNASFQKGRSAGMEEAARIAVMLPLSELAAHSDHVNPKTAYAFGARTQASNIIAAIRRAKESKT